MSMNDRLFDVERRLAEYPGNDAASLAARRVLLRESFTKFGDERHKDGYQVATSAEGGRTSAEWDARHTCSFVTPTACTRALASASAGAGVRVRQRRVQ
jgi:hypothetical protein